MKQKPHWFSLIVLISILTTGIPSCRCDGPDYVAIRDIDEVMVFDLVANKKIDANTPTFSEQLTIHVFNKLQYFSSLQFHVPGTMSEALACSPSSPLLANAISDILVFCDQNFNGIPPLTNLADQLQFGTESNLQLSLHVFLAAQPKLKDNSEDFDFRQFQIFLNSKPEPGIYTFTIEIKDNNGNIFREKTIPIQWM